MPSARELISLSKAEGDTLQRVTDWRDGRGQLITMCVRASFILST